MRKRKYLKPFPPRSSSRLTTSVKATRMENRRDCSGSGAGGTRRIPHKNFAPLCRLPPPSGTVTPATANPTAPAPLWMASGFSADSSQLRTGFPLSHQICRLGEPGTK